MDFNVLLVDRVTTLAKEGILNQTLAKEGTLNLARTAIRKEELGAQYVSYHDNKVSDKS